MADHIIQISDAELECNSDECLRILIEHRIEESKARIAELKAHFAALDIPPWED